MLTKTIFHRLAALGAGLGVNAVPLAGVFWAGWTPETAMILYLLETLLSAPLVALRVYWLTPPDERADPFIWRKRRQLIQGYLLLAVAFSLVCGVFISAFLLLVMHHTLEWAALRNGLTSIAAFLLFGFIADLFLLQPTPLTDANDFIGQSVGRVALLFFAVFVGLFLAAMVADPWFLWPFVGLKTLAQIDGMIALAARSLRRNSPT